MGHIFQLGRKYAEALGLKVLDQHGKLVTVTMGSYGVGVSRAVGVRRRGQPRRARPGLAARASPRPTCTSWRPARTTRSSSRPQEIARGLEAAGLEVLFDDRRACRPGVKFKDSELIGVPTIVVVGRGLADGVVEVKDRRSGERREVPRATTPYGRSWRRSAGA